LRSERNRIILNRLPIQRLDGDDGDLRVGFLINLGAKRFELRARGWAQDAGEIVDVPSGLRFRKALLSMRA
jgi:hypothetical protein